MEDSRKEYLAQYRKEKIHRIPLDIPNEFYDRIKAAADAEGRSVNGFIKFYLKNVVDGLEARRKSYGTW